MKLRPKKAEATAFSRRRRQRSPGRPALLRKTPYSTGVNSTKRHCESLTSGFPLLDLPTEVRLEILRHLVVFARPLHDIVLGKNHQPRRSRNYGLALPILSTCKQLRLEALPIFYRENTFDVVLFARRSDIDTRMAILGNEYDLCQPPAVLSKMRKLNVTLRGWARDMDEDETWSDRRSLHRLCETLTDVLNLNQVSLTVTLRYTKPLTWDNPDPPQSIVGALAFLRNLRSARVRGIDRNHGAQLEALMMKRERIENIWKMKTAFQDWCEYWSGDPHTWLDADATEAVYSCNLERFKQCRLEVIRGQRAEDDASISDIFQFDMDPPQQITPVNEKKPGWDFSRTFR